LGTPKGYKHPAKIGQSLWLKKQLILPNC